MASSRHLPHAAAHRGRVAPPRVHRHVLIWLIIPFLVILIAAASAAAYARTRVPGAVSQASSAVVDVRSSHSQPADRFIQSVIAEDGKLGWHQLCPDIQAQLPIDTLVQQADTMRAAAKKEGAWLTAESLGTHLQQGGWHIHDYRMTAHWPTGATRQWTYVILTQPSGCVEDIQAQDVQAQ
jgi:hypothetical protein